MTTTGAPDFLRSTSSVPPLTVVPKGWGAHEAAVERLVASYRAIPPGSTVRLAKKTSNLFRPRAATTAPGLDVTGLDGVIAKLYKGLQGLVKARKITYVEGEGRLTSAQRGFCFMLSGKTP